MPDYRIDPNDYLKNYPKALPAQRAFAQKRGLAAQQGGMQAAKQAVQPGQPSLSQVSRNQGLPTAVGVGLRRSLAGTAQAVGQGLSQGYNTFAQPFRATRQAYGQLGGALLGLNQQAAPTNSNVNAGQGAGATVPQTQQQPQQQPSLAASGPVAPYGRDAFTPNAAQAAQVQNGLEQTQFAGGTRQITPDSRTIYNVPGGYAEFQNALPGNVAARQGLPQGGVLGGAATNAEAAATLADYKARGLNVFGNDLSVANTLQARADQQEQERLARNDRRLAFRAANSLDAQRNHALATLRREDPAAYAQAVLNAPQESALGRLAETNQANRLDQAGLRQEQQQFAVEQQNQDNRALLEYDANLIKAAQSGKTDRKLDPYDQAFTNAYQEAQKASLNGFTDDPVDPHQAGLQARDALLRQHGRIKLPDGRAAPVADVAKELSEIIRSSGIPIDQYLEIIRRSGYSGPLELIAQILGQTNG